MVRLVRIIRERISSLRLGSLKPGKWRYLTSEETAALKGQADKGGYKAKKMGKFSRIQLQSEKGKRR